MKLLLPILVAASFFGVTSLVPTVTFVTEAHAASLPAVWQRKLNTLIKNINQSRQNLASADPADLQDDFKHRQWLKRLENYRQSIGKVPASDDPLIGQANQALAALESEYQAKRDGQAGPAGAAGQTASGATPAPAASASSPASGSTSQGGGTGQANVRPLVSNDRVRIKKLVRDITGSIDSISGIGPSPFQDREVVAQRQKSLNQFAAAVKRYPQVTDPDVIKLREVYGAYAQKLKTEYQRAQAQLKIVGNAFERLAIIDNRDQEYPVPEALAPPFGVEEAKVWLAAGSKARQAAEFDMKQLQEIGEHAYLPEQTVSGRMARYSFRDIDRLARNVQARFNGVQQSYQQSLANMERRMAELENQVQVPRTTDDAATTKRHRESLEAMHGVVQSGIHLESVLQRPTAELEARLAALRDRRAAYDQKRDQQIAAVRMPAPKSTDAGMLEIATQILAKPDYEFGPHGPVILNATEVVSREKESSEIDIDKVSTYGGQVTLSGTETTWTYRWREFQFATALREPDSELWRIHYIMAKYYTSGGNRTPLNQWISGGVVATDLITHDAVFQ